MQVNSISNYSLSPAFKANPQEQLFATLDDNDLKKMAYIKASNDVNDKKHYRIDKALYYSLPLAGGLSSAVGAKGRYAKLASFGKGTAYWAAGLVVLNLVMNGGNMVAQKSEKIKDFIKDHPILTTITSLTAGMAALMAFDVLAFKTKNSKKVAELLNNIGLTKKFESGKKLLKEGLESSQFIDNVSKHLKQVPAPIKEFAKTVASWSPLILVGTQLAHSYGHENAKARAAARDFDSLKGAQTIIREDLADEQIAEDIADKMDA